MLTQRRDSRSQQGFATKTLVFVIALIGIGLFAYEPGMARWEKFQAQQAVADAAQDGVAAANAAASKGKDPIRAVNDLSTKKIDVRARAVGEGQYCVTATSLQFKLGLEPVERGSCP